jgi:hypothetical protein
MLKVLHISFHKGCQNDIEYISKKLNFDLTFMAYKDEILDKNNNTYIITHEKAIKIWNLNKEYYNKFDVIITSDTAPISRIFLENNWNKKLIIWICNRIDYPHFPDEGMPDKRYYELINSIKNRPNVSIIGYTPFENYYANNIINLSIGEEYIKPIGKIGDVYENYTSTIVEDKNNTFIVGPYHNDNLMMNLKEKVESLGIKVFNGRYNGPKDLAEFAGVIHIPYAWSNLALFEGIQLEIPFFIPSLEFIKYLIHTDDNKKDAFFWSPPLREDVLYLAEWYCEEFKDVFVYFDSWDDLKNKVTYLDYQQHKKKLRDIGDKHEIKMLEKWKNIFNINILDYKFNVYSQGGEDGIIDFIFRRINNDVNNGLFIEFGASNGLICSNTRNLYEKGWTGIYIESDKELFFNLLKNVDTNKVLCLNKYIDFIGENTLDNIIDNTKFKNYSFDFISIDIDGLDYQILKSINKYLPKVILIEVNACHCPSNENIIDEEIAKNIIGQTIKTICNEAEKKGYFPLCYTGNLFLIKEEYKNLFYNFLKNSENMYKDFLEHLEIWDWGDALEHIYNVGVRMIGNNYDFKNNILKEYFENESEISKSKRKKIAYLTKSVYSGNSIIE